MLIIETSVDIEEAPGLYTQEGAETARIGKRKYGKCKYKTRLLYEWKIQVNVLKMQRHFCVAGIRNYKNVSIYL